ncbi:hypothetical protein MESS2_630049 [Mesorhizobium metallidurans STM 2683]|uniref:Uncharacterized protein n=1 Tax=Mesorhizobium metallidurans STM 2683 TaxID=1297569 RepID=M5ES49_9HYPH|nr:hypothetical protein MESS2_630049 [Mesorhizobium metallidurans STM 2683]
MILFHLAAAVFRSPARGVKLARQHPSIPQALIRPILGPAVTHVEMTGRGIRHSSAC